MTFRVEVDTTGLERVRALPQRLDWAQERILLRAAAEAERQMKTQEQTPKAHSLLVQSIGSSREGEDTIRIGPSVRYAEWVFRGRRAGTQPPFQAIFDWVRVRGIGGSNPREAAFLIARAIGRRGTRAQDYLTPTARFIEQRLPVITAAVLREAIR